MTTEGGREITATFIRSEDAGYQPGKLLLDMPYGNSERIAIYRVGRKWVEAYVNLGLCRRSKNHATRQDAMNSAAAEYVGAVIPALTRNASLATGKGFRCRPRVGRLSGCYLNRPTVF